MTRRRRLVVALAGCLAALVLVLLLGPAIYWRAVGWWRGEATYRELPTAYWGQELGRWEVLAELVTWDGPRFYDRTRWRRRPDALQQSVRWVDRYVSLPDAWVSGAIQDDPPEVLRDDPLAVPVLCELARGPWPAVTRTRALETLCRLGPDARAALPALRELTEDSEPAVARLAGKALARLSR